MTEVAIAKSVVRYYYGGMGMRAVVAYLRELRERREISQSMLASAMGLSLRQTQRWESGEAQDLKGEQIIRAIAFLEAPFDQVSRLLLDDAIGEDEARKFAETYFTPADHEVVSALQIGTVRDAQEFLSGLDERALLEELMRRQEESREQGGAGQPFGKRRQSLRPWRRGSTR